MVTEGMVGGPNRTNQSASQLLTSQDSKAGGGAPQATAARPVQRFSSLNTPQPPARGDGSRARLQITTRTILQLAAITALGLSINFFWNMYFGEIIKTQYKPGTHEIDPTNTLGAIINNLHDATYPALGYAIVVFGFIYVLFVMGGRTSQGSSRQGIDFGFAADTIAAASPGDVQQIAGTQIRLLGDYYNSVLAQANTSFRWAIVFAGIGSIFYLGTIVYLLAAPGGGGDATVKVGASGIIAGTIVQVISGINFYLYGQTTKQLAEFHGRLDQTQRFLLANNLCELLSIGPRDIRRSWLIEVIAEKSPDQAMTSILNATGAVAAMNGQTDSSGVRSDVSQAPARDASGMNGDIMAGGVSAKG